MEYKFPSEADIKDGISVISAVKNRNALLNEALPTWIHNPHVDEVIIVDWDSDEPVKEIVDRHQNGKIILASVCNQPLWILSWALNLAARISSFSRILKLDCEVKLLEGFFSECSLVDGSFYTGSIHLARDENERYLFGQAFFFREDFFQVNGYDERIKTYGWEDSDFYQRLTFGNQELGNQRMKIFRRFYIPRIRYKTGTPRLISTAIGYFHNIRAWITHNFFLRKTIRERKYICPDLLYHLPHSDELRVAHQDVDKDKLIQNTVGNRLKIQSYWNKKYPMKEFHIQQENEHLLICIPTWKVLHLPVVEKMSAESLARR